MTKQLTATVSRYAAVTTDSLQANVESVKSTYEKLSESYKKSKSQADVPVSSIAEMESKGTCGNLTLRQLYPEYKRVLEAASAVRHAEELLKITKPKAAKITIEVHNSFSIKDVLKNRGYKFFGASWLKDFNTDAIDAVKKEIEELKNLGCQITIDATIRT